MDRHYRRRVLDDSWKVGRKGIPNFPDDSFSSGNAGGKLRVPTQIILSGERRALLFADQLGRLNFWIYQSPNDTNDISFANIEERKDFSSIRNHSAIR